MKKRAQVPDAGLGSSRDATDPPADGGDGIVEQRQHHEGQQRQLPNLIKRHRQKADQGEHIPDQIGNGVGDHRLDQVNVIGDPGHQHPGLLLMEKSQRQDGDSGVELVPEFLDDPLGDADQEHLLSVHADPPEQGDGDHRQRHHSQHGGIAAHKNLVDDRLDQIGQGGGRRRGQQHAGHGGI